MIKINNIELPDETNAIRLEPASDLDEAVVGYDIERDVLMYSSEILVLCFQNMGMSHEEAWEWFYYNTLNIYLDHYPVFLDNDGDEI